MPNHQAACDAGLTLTLHRCLQEDPSTHQVEELEEATPKPLRTESLVKGDVTWMDSNWYQCHRLRNPNPDRGHFCATIQCYK